MTHGDMHLSNIMLKKGQGNNFYPKLIDFGMTSMQIFYPIVDVSKFLDDFRMIGPYFQIEGDYYRKYLNELLIDMGWSLPQPLDGSEYRAYLEPYAKFMQSGNVPQELQDILKFYDPSRNKFLRGDLTQGNQIEKRQ